jgi:hypothetical protein
VVQEARHRPKSLILLGWRVVSCPENSLCGVDGANETTYGLEHRQGVRIIGNGPFCFGRYLFLAITNSN